LGGESVEIEAISFILLFLINITLFISFQDFARLLGEVLTSKGVSASDMESWKGVTAVFVNGIAPKN
jgi:hypothetical protein